MEIRVVSVSEAPEYLQRAIAFFQRHWASEASAPVYDDCIRHCADPLPQWYLLLRGEEIIGGAGLIPNDFISRCDLYPWLCALIVEPEHRGHAYGRLLIERAKADAQAAGFRSLYLASDHVGYYERYGFTQTATGYHPWGETSGIFVSTLEKTDSVDRGSGGVLMKDLLTRLPNIGTEIARQLRAVGIDSPKALRAAGAKEAWMRILAMDPSACVQRLMALEGAIRGVRKDRLPDSVKMDLKEFYQQRKG